MSNKKHTPKSGHPARRAEEIRQKQERQAQRRIPSPANQERLEEPALVGGMYTIPDITNADDVAVPDYIRNADRKDRNRRMAKKSERDKRRQKLKQGLVALMVVLVAGAVVVSGMAGLFQPNNATTMAPGVTSVAPGEYPVDDANAPQTLPIENLAP